MLRNYTKIGDDSPYILKQDKEVQGVRRGGDEVEMFIEAPRFLIFCVHGKGANAGYIRCLQRTLHCVSQQRLANALALPAAINGKPREQHDGHGMLCQAFLQALGSVLQCHMAYGQRVITDNDFTHDPHVSLRGACLLVLPGIAQKISVQLFAATIKSFDWMVTSQFFDAPDFAHWRVPASKKPGSFIRRSKRGRGRGGASSAAKNAFHCAAFSPKVRRSARASSARASALSRTNSLTERLEAAAAALNAVLALRVNRRSSFSLRRERGGMIPPALLRLSGLPDNVKTAGLCVLLCLWSAQIDYAE